MIYDENMNKMTELTAQEAGELAKESQLTNILRGIKALSGKGHRSLVLFDIDMNPFDGTAEGYKKNWEYTDDTLNALRDMGYGIQETTGTDLYRDPIVLHTVTW